MFSTLQEIVAKIILIQQKLFWGYSNSALGLNMRLSSNFFYSGQVQPEWNYQKSLYREAWFRKKKKSLQIDSTRVCNSNPESKWQFMGWKHMLYNYNDLNSNSNTIHIQIPADSIVQVRTVY